MIIVQPKLLISNPVGFGYPTETRLLVKTQSCEQKRASVDLDLTMGIIWKYFPRLGH